MAKKQWLEPLLEKLPPQNIEAEEALLGSLLIDKDAIIKIADIISPEDFYKDIHAMIYRVMLELWERREPIDMLSAANRLEEREELDAVGGRSHLASLANSVPTASHIVSYAQIVQRKSTLRKVISASTDTIQMAYTEKENTTDVLDKAEQKLFAISQKFLRQNFVPLKDSLAQAFERMDELHKGTVQMRGIPTGFTALDNVLAGLQPSELVILAARPSIGKCVAEGTEIVSSNPGIISTIEEVVKNKKKDVFSLDSNLKIARVQASDFIDNGRKPVYKVKTRLGKEIKTTITHPFLTIEGWKPLKDIRVGDRVAMARRIPIFGNTSPPDYQIKALAYFIAEENLTEKSPRFTTSDKRIAKEFIQCIRKFPNVKAKIADKKRGKREIVSYRISGVKQDMSSQMSTLAKEVKQLVRGSGLLQKELVKKTGLSHAMISAVLNGHWIPLKENFNKIVTELNIDDATREELLERYEQIRPKNSVTEWLQTLGLMGKLSKEKVIPQIVFTFDKKGLALFLNRIFSCDGSLYYGRAPKKKRYHISYSSSSKRLIRQVQHLLLRFGVISKLRKKRIRYNNDIKISYELEIHDAKNISTFIREIGFYRKEQALPKILKDLSAIKEGWVQDTLPIEVWKTILKIKGERTWRSIYRELGFSVTHNIHASRRNPRRETVYKVGKALNSQLLKNLAQSDIYWDRITSITYAGIKQVYDLTINKVHNFVANDFVVHNSALALDLARNAAVYHKIPVGIFSLEMSKEQVTDRMLSAQAGVSLWKMRTGKLSKTDKDGDFEKLGQAFGALAEAPIFIDDSPTANIMEIKTKARRLQMERGVGLLIVDYLQLMEAGARQGEGRVQEVSEITRALKAVARELNVPVLALSQLSRAPEARTPSIPKLSDLRDSGTIEQDSDVVIFIYRKAMDRGIKNVPEEEKNIAEVHIGKHRHGPAGVTIRLYFDGDTASFKSLAKREEEEDIEIEKEPF